MDAKLNHSDLSALLAKEAGMSLAKADLLTKTVFDLIIEGLEQDGAVKINGLGTFKLTDVASRSSVNVNTGEKFEIKGHKKLVFTPADTLKECVNQPFAMFEPVEVDETYCDDAEDENEAIDDENVSTEDIQTDVEETVESNELAIVEESVVVEEPVVEVVEETVAEDAVVEENSTEQEEEQAEAQQEPQVEEVTVEFAELEEKPVAERLKRPEPVMVHVPKKDKKPFAVPEKKEKKKRVWLYVVFAVLFVVAAFATLFVLYITPVETDDVRIDTVTRIEHKTDAVTGATVVEKSVAKTEYKPDAVSGATVDATSGATPQDKELVVNEASLDALALEPAEPVEYKFVITDELALLDLKNVTKADTMLYDMVDVWAEHKVVPGETLTRIALKYYGDKRLWPYIVKYNSLPRPDALSKGMKILIPKLEPRK
ncbi:MAG: HU family DNA-binding protein [Bacteroidaceae bacterium]|nr:HU family DNA-binding protein [Bacteroidaceae bacterium]